MLIISKDKSLKRLKVHQREPTVALIPHFGLEWQKSPK